MTTVVKYSGPFVSMDFFQVPARAVVEELRKIVEDKAKESFFRQKKPNGSSSGALISSFEQKPITQLGNTVFKSIVTVGGSSAPYAPIVEHVGWHLKTGDTKPPYFFMKEGADAAQQLAGVITIKHFSGALRGI